VARLSVADGRRGGRATAAFGGIGNTVPRTRVDTHGPGVARGAAGERAAGARTTEARRTTGARTAEARTTEARRTTARREAADTRPATKTRRFTTARRAAKTRRTLKTAGTADVRVRHLVPLRPAGTAWHRQTLLSLTRIAPLQEHCND
jgi:hypothetical protein